MEKWECFAQKRFHRNAGGDWASNACVLSSTREVEGRGKNGIGKSQNERMTWPRLIPPLHSLLVISLDIKAQQNNCGIFPTHFIPPLFSHAPRLCLSQLAFCVSQKLFTRLIKPLPLQTTPHATCARASILSRAGC